MGDLGLIPGLGRSPGEGKGYQEFHGLYSPWGHKESDTTEQLAFTHLNTKLSSQASGSQVGLRDQQPAGHFLFKKEIRGSERAEPNLEESLPTEDASGDLGSQP